MSIDTITLQIFIAVAETNSFTKAAERVGRTQSAVSQQIAKLENLLDKELFIRGKALSLTSEGEIFLGYAKQIFSMHREAIDRFKEPELQGEVRFGLPEDFASVYLSDVLIDFSRIHPRVMLNIECDLTLNLFDRFKKKEFDLVLVKMNRPEDFPNGQEVLSEPLDWVGNKDYNNEETVPLVLSPKPCVYRQSALEALEKKGKKWRLVFSSPSYAGTIAAVKAEMGITVLPRPMIPKELQTLKSKRLPKLQDTHVSILKHSSDNPAVNSFEEFIIRKLN
ncbi:MAG: LysR family transcriptional regulator [Alphaproteobacteria bacterium CG11_big_fil_rev_8_21_14_0_20_44_7]|nr:MAG: LysR family transcriptional regulator [Alphaproteobacteria bacterium CG11_big_fil_rev_8_21_14_0_20_44_7]